MTSDDLATVNGKIKAIFESVHGSPIELVVALAEALGVTDQKVIAKAMSRSVRSVQAAKQSANSAAGCTENAAGCAQRAAHTQRAAPGNAAGCAAEKKGFPPNPLPKEITTSPRTTVAAQQLDARESGAAATLLGSKDLLRKLQDAAGECLDPTSFENQHCAAAKGWIAAGADLEIDILPVIAAKARTLSRHSVSSWSYFAKPVAKAVELRKAGLPAVPASERRAPKNDYTTFRAALDAVIGGRA